MDIGDVVTAPGMVGVVSAIGEGRVWLDPLPERPEGKWGTCYGAGECSPVASEDGSVRRWDQSTLALGCDVKRSKGRKWPGSAAPKAPKRPTLRTRSMASVAAPPITAPSVAAARAPIHARGAGLRTGSAGTFRRSLCGEWVRSIDTMGTVTCDTCRKAGEVTR